MYIGIPSDDNSLASPMTVSNTIESDIECGREQYNGTFQSRQGTDKVENLHSNTNWSCLIVQLVPMFLVFPFKYSSTFFLFTVLLQNLYHQGATMSIGLLFGIIAMIILRIMLLIISPMIRIILKWVIIGRYKTGNYPLWGSYYLKWWFVYHTSKLFSLGIFELDIPYFGSLLPLYYTLLGAKIGKNVKISKSAVLDEPDLLTIGDGAWIDAANVRPFTLEAKHFRLLPIKLGKNCVIGPKCYIGAGADINDDVCLGPLCSSHELLDANPNYRQYSQFAIPKCNSTFLNSFVAFPIKFIVYILENVPYVGMLYLMIWYSTSNGYAVFNFDSLKNVILWWTTPQRFIFIYAIAIMNACFSPFLRLFLTVLIKWFIIGKFVPMTIEEKSKPWNAMKYSLMSGLMSGGSLGGVTKLLGTHYEFVSIIYRLLGAKVGKRVYWPGSGIHIVEYDLLEVGDDVVFGSRSTFKTCSGNKSDRIVLEDGCMIADRCIILPGVTVGRCAVLGSGSLAREDMKFPVGSVWVGSRHGEAVMVKPEDLSVSTKSTLTPFGKAFYNHDAPYYVIPLWLVVFYNFFWRAFCCSFRVTSALMAMYSARLFIIDYDIISYSPYSIYLIFVTFSIVLNMATIITALSIEIVGKWSIMGRRLVGEYKWDSSNYCQRWQIYITLQYIRELGALTILELLEGSQYLVWYFQALGSDIGKNVCLYPNGGDPMMTEPDLVTLGDWVAVDEASLICHINTKGDFRLNELKVGDNCILKSGSRLLSGANMESHSMMLEHTLVMSGETCDQDTVWQGWPANSIFPLHQYRTQFEPYDEANNTP